MNFETRNRMKEMRLQNHKSSSGNAKTVSFLCGYDLGFQDGYHSRDAEVKKLLDALEKICSPEMNFDSCRLSELYSFVVDDRKIAKKALEENKDE